MMKTLAKFGLFILLSFSLTACVYKVDVQQGNEINPQMIERLSIGMSKRQVERAIGLPLISDPFNKNRWDYFYSIKKGRTGKVSRESASLFFDGDRLVDVKTRFSDKAIEASKDVQAIDTSAKTLESTGKKPWWKFW